MDGVHPAGKRLRDFPFVDLYLGEDYAEVKGQPGAHAPRALLPAAFGEDATVLREKCAAVVSTHGDSEVSVLHDEVMYRVTALHDLHALPVYFLRRIAADVRDVRSIGMPNEVLDFLLASSTRGLILIAGEPTAGKTTTAASLLTARLRAHGGFALAVEDPPETRLDGLHGEGRCIQIPATRRNGYYSEQLRSALRTGINMLLIGEIRDRATAHEALQHSSNGLWVVSTIHASDPINAIARLLAYVGVRDIANPSAILASGLAGVVHQTMHRRGDAVRLAFRTLSATQADEKAIRAMVRDNSLDELLHIADRQARSMTWATRN